MGNFSLPSDWFWPLAEQLLIAGSLIGILAYFIRGETISRGTPSHERYYHAGNVKVGQTYSITTRENAHQKIFVQQISEGWICIEILTTDAGSDSLPLFCGWAVQFPSNHLVRPGDLLPNKPSI